MAEPLHPKATGFQRAGLFAGLKSFGELEARITNLADELAKGAALEVFAEASLATQRVYQAREVWPGNSMPAALRQRLRLPTTDMGIDGVFVTAADGAVCYQSKFHTGRPALTWTELSTFYGLADVSQRRLVFTNCDEIDRVAEERLGGHLRQRKRSRPSHAGRFSNHRSVARGAANPGLISVAPSAHNHGFSATTLPSRHT